LTNSTPQPPPQTDQVFEVESVESIKLKGKKYFFLIKWKGYSEAFNSWEPDQHLEPDFLSDLGFYRDDKGHLVYDKSSNNRIESLLVSSKNTAQQPKETQKRPNISSTSSSPKRKMTVKEHDSAESCSSSTSSSGIFSSMSSPPLPSFSPSPSCSSRMSSLDSSYSSSPEEDEMRRKLPALIPGKVVSIQDNVQGRKGVLVKWVNHEVLSWVDYEWAKQVFPDLILDYYEALLVFA